MGSLEPIVHPDPNTLIDVLHRAACSPHGLTVYDQDGKRLYTPYFGLLQTVQQKASQIQGLPGADQGRVVLLQFSTFQENVEWFWATVFAGLLPAVSTPLPADNDRRRLHLIHIRDTLKQPIVLTSRDLVRDFDGVEYTNLTAVDDMRNVKPCEGKERRIAEPCGVDSAALMLTSGSSGNAKAVVLRHEQIIASVQGKSENFGTTEDDSFLNWIGFDHVASLIETHIHAMYLGAQFIHVPAPTVLVDPVKFLGLIDQHRVAYTFAPQFFLAKLLQALERAPTSPRYFDLSCLRHLISGGELNVVETIVSLGDALRKYNVKDDVIRPGFGMTETCAGSVYGKACPSHDVDERNVFASLGSPIPKVNIRIMNAFGVEAGQGEVGDLQIIGKPVFQGYFNNVNATRSSFSPDGWFITGDRAYIDVDGYLNIAGREQESINVNGVKYFPNEIESALDNAKIAGLTPSWTVVFPHRTPQSPVEETCVVYHPTFGEEETSQRVDTAKSIVSVVSSITLSRPKHIIPLPRTHLHKTSLGKLSRAKIRRAFEEGQYEGYEDSKDAGVRDFKVKLRDAPESATEHTLMAAMQTIFNIPEEDCGVNNSLFDFGITSTDLFSLKRIIEEAIPSAAPVPVGILLTTPTIRGIAVELDRLSHGVEEEYNPVVPLQYNQHSTKTPLWLIHPGSGDVLVFVKLARYFSDRTVYGLRTKGLNTSLDESEYFTEISEIADTYVESIKRRQPHGPYAVAGYSLGSSVAFEVSKRLEATKNEVAFLGFFDSPPHMRELIERLDWIDVLLNVAYFLELISEQLSVNAANELHQLSADRALDFIMAHAPQERLRELAIDKTRLHKLTDVTNAFGLAGKKYDPAGSVTRADVFWVTPLMTVAQDRQEWMEKHLIQWSDFVSEAPRFHECEGVHSKMLNSEYVESLQKVLKKAMTARGI